MVPSDPNTKLDRAGAAKALTEAGRPMTSSTLATYASRNIGPDYEVFGNRAIYTWGTLLSWAEARTRPGIRRSAALESSRLAKAS